MAMTSEALRIEVIQPDNPLRRKVGPPRPVDPALLSKAEANVRSLAADYGEWVQADIRQLETAIAEIAAASDAEGRRAKLQALFVIAHDVKGQGGTFDYPLVTQVAASLCRYIERTIDNDRTDPKIVEAHIGALRAILSNQVKGDGGALGQQVIESLNQVVQRGLRHTELTA